MKTGILSNSYLMTHYAEDSAVDAEQFALHHLEYAIEKEALVWLKSSKPLVIQRGKTWIEPEKALHATRYTIEFAVLYDCWLDCEVGDYAVYRDEVPWHNAVVAEASRKETPYTIMRFRMVEQHFNGGTVQLWRRET